MELHACYFKDLGAFSPDQRRASATAGKLEPGRLVSAIGLLIPQCRPGRTTKTPRLQGNLSRRSRSYGHSMGVNTPARNFQGAPFGPSVAGCAGGVVPDGDLAPGQGSESGVQVRLVPLHREHEVRGTLVDEVFGVASLGVHGVRGDDRTAKVDAVQERGEHGDLVRLRCHVDLPQDHAVHVVEGGRQVPARPTRQARSAQGLPVDGDPPPHRGRRFRAGRDLDGVGTAMITSRVMSVPSSAHPRRVVNPSRSPRQADFADPLAGAGFPATPAAGCTSRLPVLPASSSAAGCDPRICPPTTVRQVSGGLGSGLLEKRGTSTAACLGLAAGPLDALAVEHASAGAMAGVAPLGTTLTTTQAGQLGAVLGAGSNRVVVALDADPAGQQAAARAYTGLTAHGLDPRAAVLPTGLDPAATAELYGPAALVDRLALAQPMGRQLVDQALAGRELRWAEDRVTAARSAAAIIIQAPTASWEREIAAVAESTGLDESLLRTAVVDTLDPDTDPLGRLRGRDRRDDLDRGQHLLPTAADIAAVSASPATSVHRPQQPPVARRRAHR